MTFPQAPLDADVELNLAGTWTEITPYALQRAGTSAPVTITRGRPDETAKATTGTCSMQWNNRDGRFSPRNPTGPYYGQFGRNTPVRVSTPAAGVYLRFEDDTASWISAPSSSGLNITGDLELQLDLQPTSYVPCVLAGKDDGSTQRSWNLQLNADGTLSFSWSSSGSAMAGTGQSSQPLPLGRISLRVTFAHSTGTVTFYTSATPVNSSPSWTQLGTASVFGSSTSIFSSTTAVTLGANSAITALAATAGSTVTGPAGQFYGLRLYNGIAGTLKASPDFTTATPGNATLTDAQSNTWTLNGTAAFSNRSYRFHGECSSLPRNWDTSGTDVWVPLSAGGLLRRHQQGSTPVFSVMKRAVVSWPGGPSSVSGGASAPLATIAYWPCEDPQGSAQIAAGMASNSDGVTIPPMLFAGIPGFQGTAGSPSADSVFNCSAQLAQPASSVWAGTVPAYNAAATAWSVMFPLFIPSAGLPNNTVLFSVAFAGGQQLAVLYATGSGGNLNLQYSVGLSVAFTLLGPSGVNGMAAWVQLKNVGTGTATGYLNVLPVNSSAVVSPVNLATGSGNMTGVAVNPGAAALGACEIGHIWAAAAWSSGSSAPALPVLGGGDTVSILSAWNGEAAGSRFARVCAENGIQPRVYGWPAATVTMGPQQVDTLVNILQSCEDADRGVIYEPRSCLGLAYRTSDSMLNQSAAVTLSYPAQTLGGGSGGQGLVPVDDDQFTLNDVTATRSGGSSVQVQVTSGPLSINPPPAGAGDYNTGLTVNCAYDSQLGHIAGWIAHVGTTNAGRYPVIPLNLARPELASLVYAIQDGADIGAHAQMTSPPSWEAPGPADVLVWGVTEKLGGFFREITWNAVPELPWETAVAGTGAADSFHADTDGSTLHAGINSVAGSMQVDTTNASSPLWTTSAGDFPFDIQLAGEQITVTNITGASSPQTFTITRSVNGVVKTHSAGEAVALWHTPVLALA